MAALREDYEPPPREARREAYMRREIRKTLQQGHENIAVVCGAWHAPALRLEDHAVKSDDALLKGLKRRKTSATWIPWTTVRLSYRSGYGAGIASPGYYEHLWSCPEGSVASRWLSLVARLLRSEDLDAPPANVVEAARVADTLAAIRDLPAPGLDELREAALATLCGGETERLALIRDRLEIGEKLGEVPAETPTVPLQHDLERLQKRLRLKPSAGERHLDLDLREVNGRARSELLHRLRLLGVGWGEPRAGDRAGCARRPEPGCPHEPPTSGGHRLGTHHPRQPEELPARTQNGHPRKARRARAQEEDREVARHSPMC